MQFIEASAADSDIEVEDIEEQCLSFETEFQPSPQALEIHALSSVFQGQESLFSKSLIHMLGIKPYFLHVKQFKMQRNEAYLTFEEEAGMLDLRYYS